MVSRNGGQLLSPGFFNFVNACFAFIQNWLRSLPLFACLHQFAGIKEDVFVKFHK